MPRTIKGYLQHRGDVRFVGAEGDDGYRGPCASVTADWKNGWLFVNTDDYEGNAMLNIEALPYLIKALQEIEKERKAKTRK